MNLSLASIRNNSEVFKPNHDNEDSRKAHPLHLFYKMSFENYCKKNDFKKALSVKVKYYKSLPEIERIDLIKNSSLPLLIGKEDTDADINTYNNALLASGEFLKLNDFEDKYLSASIQYDLCTLFSKYFVKFMNIKAVGLNPSYSSMTNTLQYQILDTIILLCSHAKSEIEASYPNSHLHTLIMELLVENLSYMQEVNLQFKQENEALVNERHMNYLMLEIKFRRR